MYLYACELMVEVCRGQRGPEGGASDGVMRGHVTREASVYLAVLREEGVVGQGLEESGRVGEGGRGGRMVSCVLCEASPHVSISRQPSLE